jgi:hypothetical protein
MGHKYGLYVTVLSCILHRRICSASFWTVGILVAQWGHGSGMSNVACISARVYIFFVVIMGLSIALGDCVMSAQKSDSAIFFKVTHLWWGGF